MLFKKVIYGVLRFGEGVSKSIIFSKYSVGREGGVTKKY